MLVSKKLLVDVSEGERNHVVGWHPMLEDRINGFGPISLGRKAEAFLKETDAFLFGPKERVNVRVSNISSGPGEFGLKENDLACLGGSQVSTPLPMQSQRVIPLIPADWATFSQSVDPIIVELDNSKSPVVKSISPKVSGHIPSYSSQPYSVDLPSDDEPKLNSAIPFNGLSPISAVSAGLKGIRIKRQYDDSLELEKSSKCRKLDFNVVEDVTNVKLAPVKDKKERRSRFKPVKNFLRQSGNTTGSIISVSSPSPGEIYFPESWLMADSKTEMDLESSSPSFTGDYVARKAAEAAGMLMDPVKAMCMLAWKLFLPEKDFNLDHPAANPLVPGRGLPLKLMPPTLTVVAELDWMRDRAIAYSEELRKVNVDAPDLEGHEFSY
ncbi:hypothetical protein K1719_015058 [Acacia pycnantha]|nr:hypothetical protein K1719_015058 [Acacia pycnantha]